MWLTRLPFGRKHLCSGLQPSWPTYPSRTLWMLLKWDESPVCTHTRLTPTVSARRLRDNS